MNFIQNANVSTSIRLLSPTAAMRKQTNMVIWLRRKISLYVDIKNGYWGLMAFNYLVLIFIFIYGILSNLASQSSQPQSAICLYLCSGYQQLRPLAKMMRSHLFLHNSIVTLSQVVIAAS